MALRTAYIAGIFSLVICSVMLLNYWQLVTTDPLESEILKSLVERLQEDTNNEELKLEIRNLDLMARSAYFTNQWQIRSGAYLLIGGIIIMVFALRIYYSSKAEIIQPEAKDSSLDIELFISRKWILYTLSILFGLALIAAFLSVDHLSESYVLGELSDQKEQVPEQQIIPRNAAMSIPEDEVSESIGTRTGKDAVTGTEPSLVPADNPEEDLVVEYLSAIESESVKVPDHNDIIKNFPSFRGPFGLGIAYHKNIPTAWDGASGKNIKWKTSVPLPGVSSPVLWDNLIFLTGADANVQSVFCFDAQTGKLVWEHKVSLNYRPPGKVDPMDDTGFAAPSAATDGRYVFAIFPTGDLVCLDQNGDSMWSKNIGVPDNHYGHSSSLLVWKNLLLIQFDTNVTGKVLALDVHSGDLVWETTRSSKISWASPILANFGDHFELILASSPHVSAYDPESGKELWSFDCLSGEVGPSPAFHNGIAFVANEYAKLTAFKPGAPPSVLWENNEYLPEVSSPVAAKDLLFVGTSYGVIACYSSNTGEILWEYDCDRGFYASPIIIDDKVYFLDRGGKMYIFSVDGTLNFINDPELGERTVSTPAFSEGRIYIRGIDHLYCIGS